VSTRRPLYGWLTAQAISLTGTRLSMIALPWFVLTTTGSATKTGLVALFEMLPLVLLKVMGGPLIDRVGPRRVAIVCDLASLVVIGAIPLLHALDLLPFALFLGLVGLAGAFRGPGDAAKQAMIPQLVRRAGVPTERATGLSGTVERSASMLGAALAGGLIAWVGAAHALIIDAASFGVSAAVLAWSTVALRAPARPSVAEPAEEAPYLRQLKAGWDHLRSDRLLFGIAAMVAVTNLFDIAYVSVLMPVWADEYGAGAGVLGLVFAVWSGSSALGSVCAAAWASRLPRYPLYLAGFLICGAPRFAVFAWDSPMWAVVLVVVSGGFASGFLNPIISAVIFERIPSSLVGRVSSLITSMAFALMPFGGVLAGGLVALWGFPAAMLTIGAAYSVVTILPALHPMWRQLDRRPEPEEREDVIRSEPSAVPNV
jgi:MFS family permease